VGISTSRSDSNLFGVLAEAEAANDLVVVELDWIHGRIWFGLVYCLFAGNEINLPYALSFCKLFLVNL
jgi:hypothetical protein